MMNWIWGIIIAGFLAISTWTCGRAALYVYADFKCNKGRDKIIPAIGFVILLVVFYGFFIGLGGVIGILYESW